MGNAFIPLQRPVFLCLLRLKNSESLLQSFQHFHILIHDVLSGTRNKMGNICFITGVGIGNSCRHISHMVVRISKAKGELEWRLNVAAESEAKIQNG